MAFRSVAAKGGKRSESIHRPAEKCPRDNSGKKGGGVSQPPLVAFAVVVAAREKK